MIYIACLRSRIAKNKVHASRPLRAVSCDGVRMIMTMTMKVVMVVVGHWIDSDDGRGSVEDLCCFCLWFSRN